MTTRYFVTSDTHFGHENIIRYVNRPFRDWRAMGEAMIERWNRSVAPEDVVYFLGDFAMGPGATEDYIIGTLGRLNGEKLFVLGNHDQPSKWSVGLEHILKSNDVPENIVVFESQIVEAKIDGKDFVMCHYPLADWNGKQTFSPAGSVHLHGHTHTRCSDADRRDMISLKSYDIGVDMFGGPVQITGDLRYLNDPKGWA